MQVYRLSSLDEPLPAQPRAVAIGVFDGVHLAHRDVIDRVIGHIGLTATVLTFTQSPARLPKSARAIEPFARKEQLLRQMGVDELLEIDFEQIRDWSPEQFVCEFLHRQLGARRVACGENFHFGKGGAGDLPAMRALCEPLGITVDAAPTMVDNGRPISSTRIRQHLTAGDMAEVNRLLGHSYAIETTVTPGNHLGSSQGFPTVNQPLPEDAAWPAFGVYASTVVVENRSYVGVTNIGCKPTVSSTEQPLAETWIVGYHGDLYGRTVTLYPVVFMRPEQTFPNQEALFAQIARDAEAIQSLARPTGRMRAVLFDLDDTLHSRVEAWRSYSHALVSTHLPELPAPQQERLSRSLWEMDGNGLGYRPDLSFIPYTELFTDWVAAHSLALDPQELSQEAMLHFADHTAVFPDAVPALQALRQAGYRVGVITNGHSGLQHRKLDVSGLLPLLDVAVVGGDEGIQKPDPELFFRAAGRIGVAPQDCLFVGDNAETDIAGAIAAGMQPVYIDRYGLHACAVPHVPVITGLSELTNTLISH